MNLESPMMTILKTTSKLSSSIPSPLIVRVTAGDGVDGEGMGVTAGDRVGGEGMGLVERGWG